MKNYINNKKYFLKQVMTVFLVLGGLVGLFVTKYQPLDLVVETAPHPGFLWQCIQFDYLIGHDINAILIKNLHL